MATFTKLPTADPDVDLNHCDSSYDENMSESTCAAGDQSRPTTPREFEELSVGYAGEPTAQSCRTYLGSMMDHRGRRKHSHAVTDGDDVHDGLLADAFAKRRAQRSRTWYNYCIFGGISGFTILAFLLVINLTLGVATYFWSSNIDKVLKKWGQPGSGTEGLAWYPTDFTRDINPIPCHSHNDYWRRVPLFSALREGCTGVEADVWLYDADLLVGHNTASLTRNRTFTSLYVDPLVDILTRQNPSTEFYNDTNHGVFDSNPEASLTLLVDVKTRGKETWPWVLKQLEPLRERGWLTFVQDGKVHPRPITVVGTGNTPFDILTANSTYRDAFFDAPLDTMWESKSGASGTKDDEETSRRATHPENHTPSRNLGQGKSGLSANSTFTPLNSYYASVSFLHTVGFVWRNRLSAHQLSIIRGQIRGAHSRGLKVRYWDTPSWPVGLRNYVWDVLVKEGVDMLNVDDLKAAAKMDWGTGRY